MQFTLTSLQIVIVYFGCYDDIFAVG